MRRNHFRHMHQLGLLEYLPLEQWFRTCFAGCIPETSLVRIWDKLLSGTGGSSHLLIFLAVALLIHFRRSILLNQSGLKACPCWANVSSISLKNHDLF